MAFIHRRTAVFVVGVLVLGSAGIVCAQPYYLNEEFKPDPYRKPGEATCRACHQDDSGGALRAFGEAFESAGTKITPLLRTQFSDLFAYPVSRVGDVVIHFSDPENKQIIVETGARKIVVDVEKRTGAAVTAR